MPFKPNLAGTPRTDDDIPMPCLASPKIDGVRAMVHPEGLMSRSMKLIPNKHVQELLAHASLIGLDGELVVGSPTHPNCMQNTVSGVMSHDKVPRFTFYVFDDFEAPGGFQRRLESAEAMVNKAGLAYVDVKMVPHTLIGTLEELNAFEAKCLAEGYEGVMVRSLDGVYKQGRSTPKEGGLLKIKRFVDAEFVVVGFEEQMKNNNVATTNELGRTKRSSHAAGKEGKGTLGALIVRHIDADGESGVHFNIGTGMDDNLRAWIWANRLKYMGAIGTYKSFPIGVLDAPRHPVFKSFRPEWDIS